MTMRPQADHDVPASPTRAVSMPRVQLESKPPPPPPDDRPSLRKVVETLSQPQPPGWRRVVSCCRVSIVGSGIAMAMTVVPSQATEAMQILLEDRDVVGMLALIAASIALGVASWAFARLMLLVHAPGAMNPGSRDRPLAIALPRILGVLPLVALGVAFVKLSRQIGRFDGAWWQAVLAAIACGLLAIVQWQAFVRRRHLGFVIRNWFAARAGKPLAPESEERDDQRIAEFGRALIKRFVVQWDGKPLTPGPDGKVPKILPPLDPLPNPPLTVTACLAFSWIFGLGCIATFTFWPQTASWFGAMAIVPLALAVWIPLVSIFALVGFSGRTPVITLFTLMALTWAYFDTNDNHRIRTTPRVAESAPSLEGEFEEWLKSRPDRQQYIDAGRPYPVFIVATEGGGMRAAYVTAQVLSQIQDDHPDFRKHLFLISGVSGGSVGAAVFSALLHDTPADPPADAAPRVRERLADRAAEVLRTDLLAPLLAKALFPDFLQQFVPFAVRPFDRARALEDALADGYKRATAKDTLRTGFYELHKDYKERHLPLLMLNTTQVENGRRVAVSPVLSVATHPEQFSTFLDIAPGEEMMLTTAACLSARFPIVTPAGYIVPHLDNQARRGKLRFVDGGYAENSGAATLLDVLDSIAYQKPTSDQPAMPRRDVEFNIIVISTFDTFTVDRGNPTKATRPGDNTAFKSHSLGELLSPIRTMLNTRGGRGKDAFHDLDALNDRLKPTSTAPIIHCGLVTNDGLIPLGWILSEESRDEIRRQVLVDDAGTKDGDPLPNSAERQLIGDLLRPPARTPAPAPGGAHG